MTDPTPSAIEILLVEDNPDDAFLAREGETGVLSHGSSQGLGSVQAAWQ